jgi:flagellar biosynthesis anti-sigma factor FlgM
MKPPEQELWRTQNMQVNKTNWHNIEPVNSIQHTASAGSQGVSPSSDADELSLSPAATELQELREEYDKIPEVREEVVEKLRKQIQNGQYQVRDDVVADKLLKNGVIPPE